MKKLVLLALSLFFASAALANGVDNMVAQCEEVMRCKLCRVANDAGPSATKFITVTDAQGVSHGVRVSASVYDYIRNTGYEQLPDGKYLMCVRVREVMQNPDSLEAAGARVMFSATWDGRGYCPDAKP